MKKSPWIHTARVAALVLAVVLFYSGCTAGSSFGGGGSGGGSNPVNPPENLLGTIALDNGSSAVMDLSFSSSKAVSRTILSSRATVSVGGTIRYDGDDYVAGGLYDDETAKLDIIAENTTTKKKFVFSGTYSEAEGFSGSVTLYDTSSGSDVEEAKGTVSAAGVDDIDKNSVTLFTGSYGGGASGTWNGTLTDARFYGTWAGEGESGTFNASRSGSSLSYSANVTTGLESAWGTISSGGESMSGGWQSIWDGGFGPEQFYGTWTGHQVTSSNDQHEIGESDDASFLANLISQSFQNALSAYYYAYVSGDVSYSGDELGSTGVSATAPSQDVYVYSLATYTDSQTGISLTGEVRVEEPNDSRQIIRIDSDVSDTTDDGGLAITYPDGTTDELFVDAEIDFGTESIDPGDGGSAVWEMNGIDVVAEIELMFFQ